MTVQPHQFYGPAGVGVEFEYSHPFNQPVDLPFDLPTRMYGGMYMIWLLRPGLQTRFPLQKGRRDDYLRYLAWCVRHGRREYKLLRQIQPWNEELMRPAAMDEIGGDLWQGAYTVGMFLCGVARSRYWSAQVRYNKRARHRTARWYFRGGRQEIGLATTLPVWQMRALRQVFPSAKGFLSSLYLPKDEADPHAAERIALYNQDVVRAWDEGDEAASNAPKAMTFPQQPPWWSRIAARHLPVGIKELARARRLRSTTPTQDEIERLVSGLSSSLRDKPSASTGGGLPGINLYGYARGELGIGEDVRMVARALEAAGVPFCVINFEPGGDVSQEDRSAEDWLADEPQYHINLFCMTGIEMTRLVCERGLDLLEGHYNIGLWPWELPEWPAAWRHAYSLIDELWAISSHVAESYAKSPLLTRVVPLPVVLGDFAASSREDWGLPESPYLFLFSFDMNSRLSRKNPEGLVRAFKKAFPDEGVDEVGLVLKGSHVDTESAAWKRLLNVIGGDRRIHLFTSVFRRPDVLSLYDQCDCYVSLHRAEGFGRGIAEAMLLGKDVIVTAYSGNMDFCNQPGIGLVRHQMRRLEPGDYFYGEGQFWAEPDLNHAAELMRQRASGGRNRSPPEYDVSRFSPEYCGVYIKRRLQALQQASGSEFINTQKERST
ncbi:glycosyltransferase [Guyparkeria hydrothermalis]|uniref:glycosyltransferase n=1 Tax=Guyparkeria hydrothermalis TaxID=923 RepID=UPI0020203D88|nr:glycosyltransferase [Guyparkeria hydrothermalis]MCL7745474.1 glycosyltransferase [Guyparkeria hydrothermalis]